MQKSIKNVIDLHMSNIVKKKELVTLGRQKIHGTIALTATVPLLNLNLNYEKLQCKYSDN